MLTRRTLLGTLAVATVSGCALVPDGAGASRAPSPPAALLPGQAALTVLHGALGDAASAPWDAQRSALLAWSLSVTLDQHAAVHLPVPAAASPGPGLTASPGPDAAARLTDALDAAGRAFAAQALDAASAQPVVWAAMAAWAASVAAQVAAPTANREPARGVLLPAPQDAAAAVQGAADAASASLYGLQVAAGAPGLSADEQAQFARRSAAWQGLRDDLARATASASPPPSPAPPWYAVERPADAVAARALAARIEASAQEALGRSVAYGPSALRPLLVAALVDVGPAVPAWGGLLQRWPGLPTT